MIGLTYKLGMLEGYSYNNILQQEVCEGNVSQNISQQPCSGCVRTCGEWNWEYRGS